MVFLSWTTEYRRKCPFKFFKVSSEIFQKLQKSQLKFNYKFWNLWCIVLLWFSTSPERYHKLHLSCGHKQVFVNTTNYFFLFPGTGRGVHFPVQGFSRYWRKVYPPPSIGERIVIEGIHMRNFDAFELKVPKNFFSIENIWEDPLRAIRMVSDISIVTSCFEIRMLFRMKQKRGIGGLRLQRNYFLT